MDGFQYFVLLGNGKPQKYNIRTREHRLAHGPIFSAVTVSVGTGMRHVETQSHLLCYQANKVQGESIVAVQSQHLIQVEVQTLKHNAQMIGMCEVLIHSNDVQFPVRIVLVIQELEDVGFENCLVEVSSLILDHLDRYLHASLKAGT